MFSLVLQRGINWKFRFIVYVYEGQVKQVDSGLDKTIILALV